jgi:outer membrane protein assembly factor BamA
VIVDVAIQGNQQVPTDQLHHLIHLQPGSEYREEAVQDDVARLHQTAHFKDIQIVKEDVGENAIRVTFLVTEFPQVIEEISYRGAKHLSAGDLEKITGLHKGSPLSPEANQNARKALQHYYVHHLGRLRTEVELVEGSQLGDKRVVFQISEGPAAKIGVVTVTGNTFVSKARLLSLLPSTYLEPALFGRTFNWSYAERTVVTLEEYYQSYGFRQVHVSYDVQTDDQGSGSRLVIHVDEGKRSRLQPGVASAEAVDQILQAVFDPEEGSSNKRP